MQWASICTTELQLHATPQLQRVACNGIMGSAYCQWRVCADPFERGFEQGLWRGLPIPMRREWMPLTPALVVVPAADVDPSRQAT